MKTFPNKQKIFIQTICFAFISFFFIHSSFAATISVQKNDFELNTTGLGQGHASVAMLNNGTSLMVWQERGTQGLVMDSLGNILTRTVISKPSGSASHPIAAAGTNRFVVTWQERTPTGHEVFIMLLDNMGNTIAPAQSVTLGHAAYMSEVVIHPDVEMNKKGEFVVAWDVLQTGKRKVYAQSFNRLGTALSPITQLSIRPSLVTDPTSKVELGFPDVDLNKQGDAAIVWSGYDVLTASYPIVIRQFNIHAASWVTNPEDTLGYIPTSAIQVRPMVSINNKGDIATSWMDMTTATMNTAKVFYKRFDKTSNLWQPAIRLSGDLDTGANRITTKIFEGGATLVAFTGTSLDGSLDVYINFYSATNTLIKAIKVNDRTSSLVGLKQRRPAVAFSPSATGIDMIVTWEMTVIGGSDIVYGKRYKITR
ncbi:MAG: hypothetical protein JKY53_13070 [Flavobacteriales bacterium]|nr:hypothetical protein [Flavobacteriales bacterium]